MYSTKARSGDLRFCKGKNREGSDEILTTAEDELPGKRMLTAERRTFSGKYQLMFLKDETQLEGEEKYSKKRNAMTTRSEASGGWTKERTELRAAPRQWISPSKSLENEELQTRFHENHFPVDTAVQKIKEFGDNKQPGEPMTLSSNTPGKITYFRKP